MFEDTFSLDAVHLSSTSFALFKIAWWPSAGKKLIEKSRESHSHKPHPTPDTERKRKGTNTRTQQTNKQTNARESYRVATFSPNAVITMLKIKKHEDKEHGKTLKHEAPRSINNKATQNKNNTRTGTTGLERSVA